MAFYQPIDALFYAIALAQGYRLSFRQLSDTELALLLSSHPHADSTSEYSDQPDLYRPEARR